MNGMVNDMNDILYDIIANKRQELIRQKALVAIAQLEERVCPSSISMKAALMQSSSGIIAEFKRRSPSKGWIKENAEAAIIVPAYEQSGAAAVSILTDESYFGGTLQDIIDVRPCVQLPLLRKEFIIDEYQLYQAASVGGNAVLLIAAALSVSECHFLAKKAHALGLEVLLELHTEDELDHICDFVDMVGINNRNLGTFHTDVSVSFRLAKLLPEGIVRVSESGLSDVDTVKRLRDIGFRGFLIGEYFMKHNHPDQVLRTFIEGLNQS